MSSLLTQSALIIGIIVILILLLYGLKNNRNNLLLATSAANIWLGLTINHLNETGEILSNPALMRTGNIFAYLIFPFLYLYSRNTFYPGKNWHKSDWLFLLPACIYIIDLMPFFLSDVAYKQAVMKANLANPDRLFSIPEGWIGIKGFHSAFRYIWSVSIFVFQIRLLYRNRHLKFIQDESGNNKLFMFILVYSAFHIPLVIPGIFGIILHLKWYTIHFISINLSLAILSLTIYILFSPSVLYGFLPRPVFSTIGTPENQFEEEISSQDKVLSRTPEKVVLDPAEITTMISRIESYVLDNKPFLNPRYNIHDLSQDTKIPVYQLSPIINQHFATNFSNWINTYRVNQFIVLCEDPKNYGLTIDALALDAGFSNRATLTTAFKKEKNLTPGLYLKQHRTVS